MNELKWNVIDEREFKTRVENVFKHVSDSLINTLGPYGSTTIIEKFGEMHITKDGWQVLKNIHFEDPIDNNILMLLIRISAQVILKVGDGSTSSIVAANSILEEMNNDNNLFKKLRSKDYIDLLNKCVYNIVQEIYSNAKEINKETYEEIYKLAYISTNGDDEISNMIKDIYIQTHNPAIEYVKSKTDKTFYEIIDGYKINNLTYIDNIFTTNDELTCIVDNPMILMFDHKIDMDMSLTIIGDAAEKAAASGRRLIVIAPAYDKLLLQYIKKNITDEYRYKGFSTVVYSRVSLINNISQNLYNDFSIMTGGEIIREQYLEDFKLEFLDEYIGEVDNLIMGKSHTVITGFKKRNENMYNKIVENAVSKYKEMEETYRERGIVDTALNELKGRVTKLKGSMGIIHVGGYTSLEKTANYDLVEDAVKACESAELYGYNCGGNLIIPFIINKLKKNTDISKEMANMYDVLSTSFKNVFKCVLTNKYEYDKSEEELDAIVTACILGDELYCYDLIKETYSLDVINSCITDIEILKASASIISLLVSSNQYISINAKAQ